MSITTTSAPGKLLLLGDHAVVYGRPCIVTAISERMYVRAGVSAPGDTRFLDAAVALWGTGAESLSATSSFSGRYGLGSSSAVTVAALKALRPSATDKELFDAAYRIVLTVQGVGSGFDVAAAVWGGTLYFVTGGKTIEPIASDAAMPLVVGFTGVKADTASMVREVAVKRERDTLRVERIFDGIAGLVAQAKEQFMEGDFERIGKLMDFNQDYLRDLGVSSEKLESLIGAAKKAGAWGAKLSGAGGGDCMIALAPQEKRQAVEEAITRVGGKVIHILPHAPGVRIEPTDNQDELLIVVDKNDAVVGYKTRFECHHDASLIHRTVGVVVFDDAGRILLQKRSHTKDMDPGLWGISAAGHVAKGQAYEEAAHRELQEELGIDAPLTYVSKDLVESTNETEMSVLFTARSNGPFRPNPEEVERVAFFDPRRLAFDVSTKKVAITRQSLFSLRKVGVNL